jgi:hypothetical protein
MIAPEWRGNGRNLEERLLVTATKLAKARGAMLAASARSEGSGWRVAPFLWPLIDRS